MRIDDELGVVGKVRAEFQKKRPEVLVHAVEIVMVDHPCRLYDPGIGRARALTAATLRPHDARFFLRLADIQHPFVLLELPHVPLRDVVFALAPHSRRLPRCSDSVSYVTYFCRAGEAISMPLDVKVWGGRPWEPQPPPASAGVGKPA